MLIRPVCKDCGRRLVLANTGKYTSIYCRNGRLGANGCQLKTCKSVTLFERKIAEFLRQHVLTKDVVEAALLEANRYLVEQAKPTILRAYKYAHREAIREGLGQAKKLKRGGWILIDPEKRQQIEQLLREGKQCIKHIAKQVGCAPGTVCRVRDYLASQKSPEDKRRTA